jgi:hypothetical protein
VGFVAGCGDRPGQLGTILLTVPPRVVDAKAITDLLPRVE